MDQAATAARIRATALSESQSDYAAARRSFENAIEDHHNAGRRAAGIICDAIDRDGLRDS